MRSLPPLTVTWLPVDWSADLLPGDGGNPTERPCSAYHWAGPTGRYINVVAGASPFAIDRARAETLIVAGRPALLDQIHEGFDVELSVYGRSQDHPYALLGYGVSVEELRRVGEGLVPATVAGDDVYPEMPNTDLGDGRHPVRITDVTPDRVTINPIGWLTGKAADDWWAAHDEAGGAPNGYAIVDDFPLSGRRDMADHVVVTSVWARYGQSPGADGTVACELCPRVVDLVGQGNFIDLFHHADDDSAAAHLRSSPYWITITDGVVTRIDEQYVP